MLAVEENQIGIVFAKFRCVKLWDETPCFRGVVDRELSIWPIPSASLARDIAEDVILPYPLVCRGEVPDDVEMASICFRRNEDPKVKGRVIYLHADSFLGSVDEGHSKFAESFIEWIKKTVPLIVTTDGDPTRSIEQAGLQKRRYLCFTLANAKKYRDLLKQQLA